MNWIVAVTWHYARSTARILGTMAHQSRIQAIAAEIAAQGAIATSAAGGKSEAVMRLKELIAELQEAEKVARQASAA